MSNVIEYIVLLKDTSTIVEVYGYEEVYLVFNNYWWYITKYSLHEW